MSVHTEILLAKCKSYSYVYFIKISKDVTGKIIVYHHLKVDMFCNKNAWIIMNYQMTEGIVDCEQQGFQQRFDHVDNLEYEEWLYMVHWRFSANI